jgi:hypothetical protein
MGLDTTHDAWHGAYSAFSRWRDKLAEVAGYTFHAHGEPFKLGGTGMEVMGTSRVLVDLDWGGIESVIGHDLFGRWPRIPVRHDGTPDPLIVLLAHSDCEGQIQSEFCGPLADRLEELLPLLGDEDGGGHVGSYAAKTETFIRGLRAAAEAGEDVEFH